MLYCKHIVELQKTQIHVRFGETHTELFNISSNARHVTIVQHIFAQRACVKSLQMESTISCTIWNCLGHCELHVPFLLVALVLLCNQELYILQSRKPGK